MKPLYYLDEKDVMWALDVPDDAQPFGVCAVCPSCNPDETLTGTRAGAREIVAIDYDARTFKCAPPIEGHIPAADLRRHSFPAVTVETEDFGSGVPTMMITDWRAAEPTATAHPMQRQETP